MDYSGLIRPLQEEKQRNRDKQEEDHVMTRLNEAASSQGVPRTA